MLLKHFIFLSFLFLSHSNLFAQKDTGTYKLYKDRKQLEYRLNKNLINDRLALELNSKTEDSWDGAFFALQYLGRKDKWVNSRIDYAVSQMPKRSNSFNRSLLELLYAQYRGEYNTQIEKLLPEIQDPKVWAMGAEYLLLTPNNNLRKHIIAQAKERLKSDTGNVFYQQLLSGMNTRQPDLTILADFFRKDYLPGQVIMFSFQRSNRNYPGLVVIRDTAGYILKQADGNYFTVQQLARSLNGLPGYLTNGNTPQGVYRMDGFDVSKAGAIGPTRNVQLSMPFEMSVQHFMNDSTLPNEKITKSQYASVLPANLRSFEPLYQSYYAGKAGRYDIIAHGTTVKPEYYLDKPYFPFTPTLGCLCTFESWDDSTMLRKESDQQKLVEAIEQAGGPYGYAIVIDLDNKETPITLQEILPVLSDTEND